jgi:hypothetical protein
LVDRLFVVLEVNVTAEQLIKKLKAIPGHYIIKIWNESEGGPPDYWDENIAGKLIAVDEIAVCATEDK